MNTIRHNITLIRRFFRTYTSNTSIRHTNANRRHNGFVTTRTPSRIAFTGNSTRRIDGHLRHIIAFHTTVRLISILRIVRVRERRDHQFTRNRANVRTRLHRNLRTIAVKRGNRFIRTNSLSHYRLLLNFSHWFTRWFALLRDDVQPIRNVYRDTQFSQFT